MNIPAFLHGVKLPHPTNPEVVVLHTQDNASAIWVLSSFQPAWIDEMPVTASMRDTGKSKIAQCCHYEEQTQRGVLATYFGAGCKADDSGWDVLCVSRANEEEFAIAAERHKIAFDLSVAAHSIIHNRGMNH